MNAIIPLFLLAPLVLVPLGYRLLEIAAPGSRPPKMVLQAVLPAAGLLVASFWLPAGPLAAALALPWLGVTGMTSIVAVLRWHRDPDRLRPDVRHATDAAVAFLAIGAAFAVADRLGVQPFGFSATIILLTAVHFHFAGFVLPLAGALAYRRRPARWLELAIGAVVVGIPITALGFFGLLLANWSGALLTAGGGLGIGVATIAIARTLGGRGATALAVIAGASLLIAMPLAVIYATGTLVGASWLALDVMARVHGGLNALGFALPAMVAWTLERRAHEPVEPEIPSDGSDPRRLGLGAAAIVVGYACAVGMISANAGAGDLGPPEAIPRQVWLAALLMVPGAIAAIGAIRRTRPLFVAAGSLCFLQAFIAFSGVTFPFLVPAVLLLFLAGRRYATRSSRRAVVGGVGAIGLTIGAWVAAFSLTETVCWVARTGADGTLVYTRIPETNTFTLAIADVASGCDGGAVSVQGLAVAAVLAIGAIAVAELSSRRPTASSPQLVGVGG